MVPRTSKLLSCSSSLDTWVDTRPGPRSELVGLGSLTCINSLSFEALRQIKLDLLLILEELLSCFSQILDERAMTTRMQKRILELEKALALSQSSEVSPSSLLEMVSVQACIFVLPSSLDMCSSQVSRENLEWNFKLKFK